MSAETTNTSSVQTILGAGGAIGLELAKILATFTDRIRLVGRTPKRVNESDEVFPADLTRPEEVDRAIAGSAIVYVTIGFEYKTKVWQETWPSFMHNVIESCIKHKAKLVFFDNVYMCDPDHLAPLTEEAPMRPVSKKGEVRKKVDEMIFNEVEEGRLIALIARAPDFIGPKNSLLVEMVYNNLAKGKKANWMGRADKLHNFIYTPDAAKATALLGNTPVAYNQIWNLPTDRTPLTGQQWVELFAREMKVQPRIQVLPVWMMGVLGVFIPVLKEFKEMAYQFERDYVFDSSKFEERFGFIPTPPADAVRAVVKSIKH